jgi:hypothetical protein
MSTEFGLRSHGRATPGWLNTLRYVFEALHEVPQEDQLFG